MTDDNLRRISSDDELDRALAALHDDVPTDPAELTNARVLLLAAAADPQHLPAAAVAPLPARPRRRSARRWLAAAAAVLVLGTGGVVAQSVLMDGHTSGSTAVAAELNAAADKVGMVADPPVRPGQYRYLRWREWEYADVMDANGPRFSYFAETVYEIWVPANRSQTWMYRMTRTGKREWIGNTTDADVKAAGLRLPSNRRSVETRRARCGSFYDTKACTDPGGWSNPTPAWLARLPRDPQRLYERLRADSPHNSRGDAQLLEEAATGFRSGLLPSDVRAALYRALAKIPGLQITDRAANLDGRVGIAYGMVDGNVRNDIIIDPRTGQYLGERTVLLKDAPSGRKAGTVSGRTAFASAVVNRIGQHPR